MIDQYKDNEDKLGIKYQSCRWDLFKTKVSKLYLFCVGLYSLGLQGSCLPSCKIEKKPQSQQQKHQWLNWWGNLLVWSKVSERHPTMCGTQQTGCGSGLHFLGVGVVISYGGTNFRWAYQLPGKPAEAYFSAIILIRTITRWSLYPVWRKASHVLKI